MRINNTSIQGFFTYSDTAEFEKGDFVVYEKSIYICSPSDVDVVVGEIPSESKNFYVYLGTQMTDIQDYLTFAENGGGEDKYISLEYLPAILNTYMQGFTGKGIIGNSIGYTKTGEYEVILNGKSEITKFTDYNKVLANILIDSDINNAIFRISRKLPEVQSWLATDIVLPTQLEVDEESCILKQYSYLDVNGNKVRVQEIIDHLDGQIYYRSAYLTQTVETIVNAGFKCATVNTESLRKKANNLFNLYASKLKALDSLVSHLKQNFRYRHINLLNKSTAIILQNSDPDGDNYIHCENIRVVGSITVNTMIDKGNELNGIYESFEFSFDPMDDIKKYYINDNIYAEITTTIPEDSDFGVIGIALKTIAGKVADGIFINSIFYQEYYT